MRKLFIIISLLILAGCNATSIEPVDTPTELEATPQTGDELTSLDDIWNQYTNYDLGFSVKVPKTAQNYVCENDELVNKIEPVVVRAVGEEVYVTFAEFGDKNEDGSCTTVADYKPELAELDDWMPGIKIVASTAKNDDDILAFVRNEYGQACKSFELIETPIEGISEIAIEGTDPTVDINVDQGCWLNYISYALYSPQTNRIAKWDIGQDTNLIDKDAEPYDFELSNSFRFLD